MKERYIQMRNQHIIDWQFIYDYSVSKGYSGGVQMFNQAAHYLNMVMVHILEQLDHEYELTILYDKQGNFIKIVT
jgi:hypothetical protein